MDDHETQAKIGIQGMQSMLLLAEGDALLYKAKELEKLLLKFKYTIEKSEKELPAAVSAPFLTPAMELFAKVSDMRIDALLEAEAKTKEAKDLAEKIVAMSHDNPYWPDVLGG